MLVQSYDGLRQSESWVLFRIKYKCHISEQKTVEFKSAESKEETER